MDINTLVNQLPNFTGFLLLSFFMYKMCMSLIEINSSLVSTIIKRENCDDSKAAESE